MDDHFNFAPPPECPVFKPTKEEFKDPLEYIQQISPIAVKTGICKIIPPDDWRPPFSVNVNSFQFTPRVQKLYELEAQSRIKLNFMTKLSQFVQLQGSDKLKIPNINGKHLDLYKFHKIVNDLGGYDHVNCNKLWSRIATKLYPKMNCSPYILKSHYDKIILPYERLVENNNLDSQFYNLSNDNPKPVLHPSTTKKRKSDSLECVLETDVTSVELKRLQFYGAGPKTFTTKPKIKMEQDETDSDCDGRSISSLKRKCMSEVVCAVCNLGDREDRLLICDDIDCDKNFHTECLDPPLCSVPKQSWKCQNCVLKVLSKKPVEYGFPSSSVQYSLHKFGWSADRFKANYFAKELHELVPCSLVEKEFWRILQSFNDDIIVEYGADIHSSHQGSGFPTLKTIKNGKCARNNDEPDWSLAEEYSAESWNLNNLPVNKKSILRFIRGNIDGMKVPWCYVGMVFSSFCWHIEDHWSYSINYLHWGEPKTWYGVSSEAADKFENAMKKQAPELFENHPDLLHHITTIMNPNILQKEGVPIYRTDQQAGQFIVTFPRAYHAGFNQGFNFAEAVNFCPANWLPKGRACVDHYAQLQRHCVFSHEELLCTIAEAAILEQHMLHSDIKEENNDNSIDPELFPLMSGLGLPVSEIQLDTNIRRTVHAELKSVIEQEKVWRSQVESLQIPSDESPTKFECMKDDARACVLCQTTCFMSAIQCCCVNEDLHLSSESGDSSLSGNSSTSHHIKVKSESKVQENYFKIYCLRHLDALCSTCNKSQLKFHHRFTIDQLEKLLLGLEIRLQDLHNWEGELQKYCGIQSSNTVNEIKIEKKVWSMDTLKNKLNEGAQCGFDTCQMYFKAKALLERGQNLSAVCEHWYRIIKNLGHQPADSNFPVPKSVLVDCQNESGCVEVRQINVATLSESSLYLFNETIKMFPLKLNNCDEFVQLIDRMFDWRTEAQSVLEESLIGDPSFVLPKAIKVFDDAKALFPGWVSFANEITVLMLLGKTLQWRIRMKECEKKSTDFFKTEGHVSCSESSLLPLDLVRESTINELLLHGQNILTTFIESKEKDIGDLVGKYLLPQSNSIKASMQSLDTILEEVNCIKDQIHKLPKRVLNHNLINSMKELHARCLKVGVRIKEFDEVRARIYRSCIEMVLATPNSSNSKLIDLNDAMYLLELGANLFNEGVLNRSNEDLTQKHLAAKSQFTLLNRSIRKLKSAFTHEEEYDDQLLAYLLPRTLNSEKSDDSDNAMKFKDFWYNTQFTEGHLVAVLRLYQSMIVSELDSINELNVPSASHLSSDPGLKCCVCGNDIVESNVLDNTNITNNVCICNKCSPRTKRPAISEIANINKLLKQNPYIVSIYGTALQALSKRTVTWLESLVNLFRLKLPYLYSVYRRLPSKFESSDSIPKCISNLFNNYQASFCDSYNIPVAEVTKEEQITLLENLYCLQRTGSIIEVNVDTYVTLILAFIQVIQNEIKATDSSQNVLNNNGT